MKAENARQVQGLIEHEKFNPATLCSGANWRAPYATKVSVRHSCIPSTCFALPHRPTTRVAHSSPSNSGSSTTIFNAYEIVSLSGGS
ncbi:hypothetical protein J4Y74_23335, partial [Escherichia coli]